MAKTPKKAWNNLKPTTTPSQKDDGTRWRVVRDGTPVYPGPGITRREAQRLSDGLREPAELVQVT